MIVRKLLQSLSLSFILLSYQQFSNATALTNIPACTTIDQKTHRTKAIKPIPRPQPTTSSETTLPTDLSHYQFLQHVANELGWVSGEDPHSLCDGYYAEPSIVSRYPHPGPIKQTPAIITAQGPSTITANGLSILQENVVVTQPGRLVQADKAYIYRDGKTGHINKIVLVGHVKLRETGKLIVADRGSLTLYPKTAKLVNVAYHIYSSQPLKGAFNAWGTATHGYRDEKQVIHLRDASYTTCSPTNPTWIVRASRIVLDRPNHEGKAYNARLRFKGIPLLYTPYYSFPLDHQRKTGFLSPRLGYMSKTGGDFAFPFYWNLAPNYDLTLTPEYLTQRNSEYSALFRFLSERSSGQAYLNYLPFDPEFQTFRNNAINTFFNAPYDPSFFTPYFNTLKNASNSRGFFSLTDTTHFGSSWSSHIDLNYTTDPYFFKDLGGQVSADTQTNQLLNRLDLQYSGWHWDFMGMVQAYQTLQIIDQYQNPVLDQYTRLPDLRLDGYYPFIDHDIDLILNSELVNFTYQSVFIPNKPIGQRLHLRPGLSFPINFASGYFKPEAWADMTGYNVDHLQPGQTSSADRTLPILDVDSGLYFDRDFSIGKNGYLQTFEPRFFYLFVPYQNQNSLPNFDTYLLPFSFEQLFSYNVFTGDDRLQNANQISLGLTSRILKTESGTPIITGNLGMGYYITTPKVCLAAGCAQTIYQLSPIVSELIYSSDTPWSLSGSIAWDPNIHQTNNTTINASYNRDATHVVSLGYVFVHENGASIVPATLSEPDNVYSNNTSQVTASVIWPLVKKWSAIAYWDYNITRQRTDAYFFGAQYDTCCWTFRLITQRFWDSATVSANGNTLNSFRTSYYVQLQLKGLGDFGTTANLSKVLSSPIPGFSNN